MKSIVVVFACLRNFGSGQNESMPSCAGLVVSTLLLCAYVSIPPLPSRLD
jgi:hypothetical protein